MILWRNCERARRWPRLAGARRGRRRSKTPVAALVRVAPLRGWYHASHDREPSVLPDDDDSRGFSRRWADYRKCRWPPALLGRNGKEAVAHGMDAGDHELSAYFASTNDIARDDIPLVTFSHYSPRFGRARKTFFTGALFSQGERLGPPRRACFEAAAGDSCFWAHAHIPSISTWTARTTCSGRWGLRREQSRQCARAKALGPLELFRTDTGARAAARPRRLGPERTARGQYYSDKPRTPSVTEPAPWVASYRKRRAKKVREPRVPNHAGYDEEVAALSRRSIVERLGGLDGRRLHEGLRRGVC